MQQNRNKYNKNWAKESANYWLKLVVIFMAIGFTAGCGKTLELNSKWRNHNVNIDEISSDWGKAAIYAGKEKVSLTLLNDSNYMYIKLYSRARSVQAQILGMGFTIWFDPKGGKNKTFGIHFPLGRLNVGMPMMARNMKNLEDPEQMFEKSLNEMNEMEIVVPGKEESRRMLLGAAEAEGINVKIGRLQGNLIYQLKIPLNEIGLSITGTDTNAVIGIGFETPKINREEMRKKMEGENAGGMPPAGGPGMPPGGTGGKPSGRMPGGRPPGAGETPERLNLWISVKLASEPSVQE